VAAAIDGANPRQCETVLVLIASSVGQSPTHSRAIPFSKKDDLRFRSFFASDQQALASRSFFTYIMWIIRRRIFAAALAFAFYIEIKSCERKIYELAHLRAHGGR
jgi:hypothetical protein